MNDFTFDVHFIDMWRGIPHHDKIAAIQQALVDGVAVSIKNPADVLRDCDCNLIKAMIAFKEHNAFTVLEFNDEDRTVRLEPLTKEAFDVSPKTHQCHVAYLTTDQDIDGKIHSNIQSVLCFYFTNIEEELERQRQLEATNNDLGGQLHEL